jgi:hypothetical protein
MPEGSRSSSSVETTPPWVRWIMPSVADLIFVALLCVLVFTPLAVRLLGDAGIGWHIRTGQQILATHAIPRVDSFSVSTSGKPWFAWEWLYDLSVGRLDASLGLNGVVWFSAVIIAAVFAWMFHVLIARGAHLCVALGLLLLAVSASTIHFLARPHLLSWLFTLLCFWILDSSERASFDQSARDRRLWLLPPLIVLWVNVHGGWIVAFVLLAIFWLGAVWNWFSAKEHCLEDSLRKISATQRIRDLTAIGLLSAAASLLNPYGWKLHAHVYSYLSNHFLIDHIDEFQSPNFHGIAQKCFLALLLITLTALALRARPLRLSQGLTILFAVYAGLYASRNIPVSSLLLAMILGPLLSSKSPVGGFFQRMANIESRQRGHAWPALATVFTLWIAYSGGRLDSTLLMNAHFDPHRMPADAVNFLVNQDVKGPVLSPDYWGGYLIYRLYPREQVVVDDRHDLYGEAFFKSYLNLIHAEPGWKEFLHEHPSPCVLLPKSSSLSSVLSESRDWKLIYADNVADIFVPQPPVR